MKSICQGLVFAVSVVICQAPVALAQEPGSTRLTLQDARTRAVETSHRLAEIKARGAIAEATVLAREAATRPIVGVGAGYTRTNHVTEFVSQGPDGQLQVLYADAPDNYRTRLDVQWPIYSGGRPDALERAARAEAGAIAADIAAAQADLRLEVARAFWDLVAARATVTVIEQGVQRAQTHLSDARERLRAGVIPPNEVASAEAQESHQRMLLIEARNQVDLASASLGRLTGLESQSIEPQAALEQTSTSSFDVSALVTEARGLRDERRALERRVQAAEEQRRAAAAGLHPVIAVAGGYDYARPNPKIFPRLERWDDSWDAGVIVTWPLWDGGRTDAETAQAAGAATVARERLAEFDSVLALELRQRVLDITSGQASIAAAQDAVRAAAEARRVVDERYRAGVATYSEVLDAESALLQAGLDRTRALTFLQVAQARLDRAVGR